jgi:serine/threonine protein kinase
VNIDFGCATWDQTSKNQGNGEISFMALEIWLLSDEAYTDVPYYDKSVDIWSMGLTTLLLFSPFQISWVEMDEDIFAGLLLPAIGTVARNDDVPEWVTDLLDGMLELNPDKRVDKAWIEDLLTVEMKGLTMQSESESDSIQTEPATKRLRN